MSKRRIFGMFIFLVGVFTIFTVCEEPVSHSKTPTYTVTFNSNGGSAVSPVTVESGKTIAKPADPTKNNFAFAGWFTDNNTFANAWDFTNNKVTAGVTLYAKWETAFTVKFVTNIPGTTLPDVQVPRNSKITKPDITNPGKRLEGWFRTAGFTGTEWNFSTNTVTSNITLYAKWGTVQDGHIVVTFNSNGGSDVADQALATGSTLQEPQSVSKAGYTLDGWYTNANFTAGTKWNFTTSVGDKDFTLYAKWVAALYTVTFNSNGGSSVASAANVAHNTVIPRPSPDPTKADFAFAGWFTDNTTFQNEWNFTTGVTGSFTLYAKWAALYTVKFVTNCAATVPDRQAAENSKLVLPSFPNPGNNLVGWFTTETFNPGTEWNFATKVVTGPVTLYAKWEAIVYTYTVGFNSNGGSAIAYLQNVQHNATIAKPTDPTKAGSTFAGWFKDNQTFNTPWNFTEDTVTGNITLHAKWDVGSTVEGGVYLIFDGPAITNVRSNGLSVDPGGDSTSPVMKQYGGEWALDRGNEDFMFWLVNDPEMRNASTVTLEIKYFDNAPGSFGIQYRSATDAHRGAGNVQKTGTGVYLTTWIVLENCAFNISPSGMNKNAQMRFGSGAIIKSVRITEGGLPDTLEQPPPAFAPQTSMNTIIGKGVAGYQSWFHAMPASENWGHWARGWGQTPPGKNNVNVEMWPHTADYTANGATLYSTNFANLGNGSPSVLFNSRDREVIFTHFQWMRDYGIDAAAVQRFYGDWPSGNTTARTHLMDIQDAAEAVGVASFYVMYDLSGWFNGSKSTDAIKTEWINNIEGKGIASSPSYAHAEGKPVVCIWGLGPASENNWVPDADAKELAEWFRNRGYFVIGGSVDNPNSWNGQSQEHREAYAAFDMLMPWPVGRYGDTLGSTNGWMSSNFPALKTFCDNNPRSWADNQPIRIMGGIYTGGGWTNLGNPGDPNQPPKDAGQPMWNQISLLLNNHKPDTFYICMFDEYDESTAIMKAGSDYFDIPTDQWFLTLSTDGWWLSNDYYLRVAQAGINIIKNPSLTAPQYINIPHSLGPLYYRNSFEKRDGWRNLTSVSPSQQAQNVEIPGVRERVPDLALDPGLKNPMRLTNKDSGSVTLTTNTVPAGVNNAGKSGRFVFHLAGSSSGNGRAYYKIAEVEINSNTALQLKYSLKPLDNGGRNVFVDILFSDGTLLSESNNTVIAQRGTTNTWTDVTITGIPSGKAITGVVVGYSGNGGFSAHVDDIIIQEAQ